MYSNVNHTRQFLSLLAATLIALTLQGSMLAGFDHLAAQSPAAVFANCNAATLVPPGDATGRPG